MSKNIALVDKRTLSAAEKRRAALETRLFEIMNGDEAGREFLERVVMLEGEDRALVDEVLSLGKYSKSRVAAYIRIDNAAAGCVTPAEEFITEMVTDYECGLTPLIAMGALETFRINFEEMAEHVKDFSTRYKRHDLNKCV
jgi:hypothetical protein